jgi:membrane-associated phospholipid phosphatase
MQTAATLVRSPWSLGEKNVLGGMVFVFALVLAILERGSVERVLGCGTLAQSAVLSAVTGFVNTYCGGAGMTVLGVSAYLLGRWRKSDALSDAALVFAAAGFWSFGMTALGQFVLADMRPKDGGALGFFGIHGHGVSGHASSASLLALPVRDVLLRERARSTRAIAGVLLVAWALFVGWSRVYLGMHHAWNVVLGLGLGFSCARAATTAFTRSRHTLP